MTQTASVPATKYPVGIGDVIEYQPRVGKPRIVEVTAVHGRGFDAVLTGNRLIKAFGYYPQITRVLREAGVEVVVHKTKTKKKGPGFVLWECSCLHSDVGVGETDDEAMRDARLQQRHHYDAARGMVS
jgi:hypothetical protein